MAAPRGKRGATAVEDAPDSTVDTATENTVPTESPEATKAAEATPKESKATIDKSAELAAFTAAVDAATTPREEGDDDTSNGADPGTGAISDDTLASLVSQYQGLTGDRKSQNAAKQHLNAGLGNAVDQMNVVLARAFLAVQNAIESAAPTKAAPKTPVDPTADFVQRYATLTLAVQVAYNTAPIGVAEDWLDQASTLADSEATQTDLTNYLHWLGSDAETRGDEPKVSDLVKNAVKVAAGRTTRKAGAPAGPRSTFEGERGDIGEHIRQAFENVAVGDALSVSQIVSFESKGAGYEGRKPSQGAVSSRLKSAKWDVAATGIEPIEDSAPYSARKVS